jgi:toxin ParE1/3/4
MGYNLLIQTEALLEIREAFEWYEEQKTGLGYELIEEIEICYKRVVFIPNVIPTSINYTGV